MNLRKIHEYRSDGLWLMCPKCKTLKHADVFSNDKTRTNGKVSNCNQCRNKQNLNWLHSKGIHKPKQYHTRKKIIDGIEVYHCGKCKTHKTKELFSKSKYSIHGIDPYCRECCKIMRKEKKKLKR